jgi:hypothetical protein
VALSFAGTRVGAERDPRLAVALGAAGSRLTQTLAAALQLVARWQDAHAAAPCVWAVLTAALDVARRPRPAQYRSAPGCRTRLLTPRQLAEAPGTRFASSRSPCCVSSLVTVAFIATRGRTW